MTAARAAQGKGSAALACLLLALGVSLTGCSAATDAPSQAAPAVPAVPATAAPTPAGYRIVDPRLEPEVVEQFGIERARRGVALLRRLLVEHELRDDLLTGAAPDAALRRAARAFAEAMAPRARTRWQTAYDAHLASGRPADPRALWELLVVDLEPPDGTGFAADGPVVVDRSLERVSAADARGPGSMRVRYETRAELRLVDDTGAETRLPVLKTTTAVVRKVPGRWVVLDYRGSFVPLG